MIWRQRLTKTGSKMWRIQTETEEFESEENTLEETVDSGEDQAHSFQKQDRQHWEQ